MSTPQFSLYYYDQCPFCQRVLQAIKQKSVKVDLRNTLTNPKNKQELVNGGGRTTVPCLKIEENGETRWMYESMDIINYLAKVA